MNATVTETLSPYLNIAKIMELVQEVGHLSSADGAVSVAQQYLQGAAIPAGQETELLQMVALVASAVIYTQKNWGVLEKDEQTCCSWLKRALRR